MLERLDVGAQARDRRAQLVARILDQVPLRLDRALQRGQGAVEAASQAGQLVAARESSRRCDRSGSTITASVLWVKRVIGASAARATNAPSSAATATPTAASAASTSSSRPSDDSTSVSGRATCTAPRAPSPTVSTRRCTPSTVASVNARPVPLPASSRARSSTGSTGGLARGRLTVPSGVMNWNEPAAPPNATGGGLSELPPPSPSPSWSPRAGLVQEAARAVDERVVDLAAQLGPRRGVRAGSERDRTRGRRRRPRPRRSDRGDVTARAARSRRRGSCGSAAARRPPPACGAGSRRRRAARSRQGRSRSPRRGRR